MAGQSGGAILASTLSSPMPKSGVIGHVALNVELVGSVRISNRCGDAVIMRSTEMDPSSWTAALVAMG